MLFQLVFISKLHPIYLKEFFFINKIFLEEISLLILLYLAFNNSINKIIFYPIICFYIFANLFYLNKYFCRLFFNLDRFISIFQIIFRIFCIIFQIHFLYKSLYTLAYKVLINYFYYIIL